MIQQSTISAIAPAISREAIIRAKQLYNHSIEGEVLALQAGLTSGNLSKTKATLAQLRWLSGMISGVGSRGLKAMIGAAIAKAQRHIAELEADDGKESTIDASIKFEANVYVFMSDKAKNFYRAIDADAHYAIAPVGEDGELVTQATKKVEGKTLRRMMSLIKFHSLNTANKKKVLYDTFGAAEAEAEGTPRDKTLLAKKRAELSALHDALDDMEAYKAHIISHVHPTDESASIIEKNHEIIVQAHDQIDEVIQKYDDLIENIDNGMAMATLKVAKLKMKAVLKDDVIDHVLLDQKPQGATVTGGVGVDTIKLAVTGSAFGSQPDSVRP